LNYRAAGCENTTFEAEGKNSRAIHLLKAFEDQRLACGRYSFIDGRP